MEKYRVIFDPSGERELVELVDAHPELRDLALRYAEELADFPPEKWVDIHSRHGEDTFKSDNHLILDIQGLVHEPKKIVVITRFRLRRKA